ncbi:hypothetical protein [Tomitella biformata]|uniref:hypothetical protein n=1 Tax=Tomitella biformata TaxID=630403 RepID=UPI0011DDC669|nr:hypothetical protein [Tomitella biformata]
MNVSEQGREPIRDGHRPVMRRRRGALCGVIVMLLGLWGALIPFVGPYFNFSFTPDPDTAWVWTSARGWLEVLPGAAAFIGGLLLVTSGNRLSSQVGAVLGALSGAWFIVGRTLAPVVGIDGMGTPGASGPNMSALQDLAFFGGLGAIILFFSALMIGRLSTFGARDDETLANGVDMGARRGRFYRHDVDSSDPYRHERSGDEHEIQTQQEGRGPNSNVSHDH